MLAQTSPALLSEGEAQLRPESWQNALHAGEHWGLRNNWGCTDRDGSRKAVGRVCVQDLPGREGLGLFALSGYKRQSLCAHCRVQAGPPFPRIQQYYPAAKARGSSELSFQAPK